LSYHPHPSGRNTIVRLINNLPCLFQENGEKRRAAVCKLLVDTIPGMIEAHLLLAKAHIILNEAKPAQKVLQNVIDHLDQSNPQAHLLMAQIQIDQVRIVNEL
jgi:hypothetical protein